LPREIELIEVLRQRHPKLPQVVCFDTAFHQTMPRVAKLLPISATLRRQRNSTLRFHGLSYAYLMEELARLADSAAKKGPCNSRASRQRCEPRRRARWQKH